MKSCEHVAMNMFYEEFLFYFTLFYLYLGATSAGVQIKLFPLCSRITLGRLGRHMYCPEGRAQPRQCKHLNTILFFQSILNKYLGIVG